MVPLHHLFGSGELSMLTPAIAERAPAPYVALGVADAAALGLRDGDGVDVQLGRRLRGVCRCAWTPAWPRAWPGCPWACPACPACRRAWVSPRRAAPAAHAPRPAPPAPESREAAMPDIIRGLLIALAIFTVALGIATGLIWYERRLLGFFQDRYGPDRVGPFGLLQVVADMIKIFTKEDWMPPFADRAVFVLAPTIVVTASLLSFLIIPVTGYLVLADLNVGLLFFLAMSSLAVYSVVLAGWSSNSKYSLLGSLRAAGQMISYEVFMGLSLMGVVMLAGSFNLGDIVEAQRGLWFWCRSWAASSSSSSPASPRRAACPSTCRRPRASWWPATTPSTRA